MEKTTFAIMTATREHHRYIPDILSAIRDASRVKGNSIVMRDPQYLAAKMDEGKAVIALDGNEFAGFCYLESWQNDEFVAHSGLIVKPEYRGQGLASEIKGQTFQICRKMFPNSRIFNITKSEAVRRIDTHLGFKEVSYTELTVDPEFWKGCQGCPHYQTLLDNNMQSCLCRGLLFTPISI